MDKPSDNVIKFPPEMWADETNPPTLEVARNTMTEIKREYCEETTEFVFDQTLGILQAFGYLTRPEKINQADMKFLEEVLMATVCRYSGLVHPLHELIDSIVEDDQLEEDEEELEVEAPTTEEKGLIKA